MKAPSSSEEGVGGGAGPTRKILLERAAAMRRNPTEPEKRLWMALRDSRFADFKFRRQAVMGNRIVDFFCPARGLVIEVDGETHDREQDIARDAAMEHDLGFATMRVTNEEIMRNLEGVLIALGELLAARPDRWSRSASTTPRPPPLKRRGRDSGSAKAPSSSEEGVGGGVVADQLRRAADRLSSTSDTPRLDAELLMAQALGVGRSDLLLRHMQAAVPEGFAPLLERRMAHEPIAYILGHQEFYGLDFRVGPAVLIPRGDSEVLVETALRSRPDATRVLDCGTGSGALLLAVLTHLPEAHGIGIDRSAAALDIATTNAAALGLQARARMALCDWDAPGWADDLGGPFDLILANPPYVEDDAALAPSVRAHEPAGALFAGIEGLDAYRVLLPQLPGLLRPGGAALVEIGASQADAVCEIARAAGFAAALHRDLAGRPRVLSLTLAQ